MRHNVSIYSYISTVITTCAYTLHSPHSLSLSVLRFSSNCGESTAPSFIPIYTHSPLYVFLLYICCFIHTPPPLISSNVIYILSFGFRFQGARSPAFNCILASLRYPC